MIEDATHWYGMVEDATNDPEKLGRVKVRIFSIHSEDKSQVPTEVLPWAHVPHGPWSASSNGVGMFGTGLNTGSMVYGHFIDGEHKQQPIVQGVIPGKPNGKSDTHPLAQGTNTLPKGQTEGEPSSPYKATYPNNKVFTTSSGHVIEVDDTPGAERIHLYHKSGTYQEVSATGRTVIKNVDDCFEIDVKNKNLTVTGDWNTTVKGKTTINSMGDCNLISNSKITLNGSSDINITGSANINVSSGANLSLAGQKLTLSGSSLMLGGSNINLTGASVALTGNVTINGRTPKLN